ncbi:MAG: polymerase sigma-70 factor, subfamily [Actinomycetota bacterium]|nr:polymerase sigma-70 factor, subfamily [Actinomycetota bacterium]
MVPEADARDRRAKATASTSRGLRSEHDTDDVQLVRAVASGDGQALAAIYKRHADNCYALARRVLNDRTLAEEVVQELFVRLWREPERFDATRGTLRSFLLAQVHGRSVDLLRAEVARRGREEREAMRAPASSDDLERAVLDLTEAEAVRAALANLSEGERSAIELAYFGGHSYREVATLLEQPEGTVKSRIRSGLLRLRAALIDAGILE